MKLTYDQKMDMLDKLEDQQREMNSIVRDLQELFGGFDGRVCRTMFELFDNQVGLAAHYLDIPEDVLCWHIYDNEFGRRKLRAENAVGDMIVVCSNSDLLLTV